MHVYCPGFLIYMSSWLHGYVQTSTPELMPRLEGVRIEHLQVPQQTGAVDCGIYLLHFLHRLLHLDREHKDVRKVHACMH